MNKPKIMVVGCFHMAGHTDLRGVDAGNIFSDDNQKEITLITNNLKNYGATKIAVEVEKVNNDAMNKKYHAYINGNFSLTSNEVHQIGFRFANELNHKQLYAIDWMERGAATRPYGDVYEYSKNNQPELHRFFEECEDFQAKNPSHSISDIFRFINSEPYIKKTVEMYVNHAKIGVADDYYGMGWLVWWYQRNLIIFANLAELVEPNDKIMLLIGSSHVGILNGLLNDSGLFEVVSAADYL
jgi:hypothetical protein